MQKFSLDNDILNKLKANKKNAIIGVIILLALFIGIGIGSSGNDTSSKEVQVAEKTIVKQTKAKKSQPFTVKQEHFDTVKRCLSDRFFAHMKKQLDFDCYVQKLFENAGNDKFYVAFLTCRQALNPNHPITEEEAKLIQQTDNPLSNQDLTTNIGFMCGKF